MLKSRVPCQEQVCSLSGTHELSELQKAQKRDGQGRSPQRLHHPLQKVKLGRPREEGQAQEEFRRDAPQRPHVDGGRVVVPQQHLGGAVEAALRTAQ